MAQALLEEVAINPTIEPLELTQDWVNRLLEGTNKTLCAPGPRRKEQWPHKRLTHSLACECPGVSSGGMGRQWPAAGSGALNAGVCAWNLLKEVTIIFITPTMVWPQGQTTGREHSPTLQQKIGLKIYWAQPQPTEQGPVSPSITLSHQEASISLLSVSIRGQTDWKPQSQKTNQTDYKDHSLV